MCDTLQLNWKLDGIEKNNNKMKRKSTKKSYTLRAASVQKRVNTETKKPRKRGPKPRPKPLPMSKYRRKTANLRERMRMGEINNAFDLLKDKIPALATTKKGNCEKMTKINVLHVAIGYIKALESILENGDAGVQEYGTAVVQSPKSSADNVCKESIASPEKPNVTIHIQKKLCKERQQKKKCSKKDEESLNSSGSEDSGIMDDDDDDGDDSMDDDADDVTKDCPDWTELTSTLDLNSDDGNSPPPPNLFKLIPPPPTRGNLDTLLTLSAPNVVESIPRKVLQPKTFNRQVSWPDLATDASDLFSDLSNNFVENCLEELSFEHEDPFQIMM